MDYVLAFVTELNPQSNAHFLMTLL